MLLRYNFFMNLMDKISFYTALFNAKSINHILHLLKRPGTSLPGYVAMKISKNFLSHITNYCQNNVFTVTGTNGKTTTSGILAHILKTAKHNVLHNEKGANMPSGIATSLAVNCKPFSKFDYAVLETDEAYLTKLYDYLSANYLLITNLFRDQLDRYGELDATAKKIQGAIEKNPNLKLLINADDPMLMELGKDNEKIFFGFDDIKYETTISNSLAPAEIVTCHCGQDLSYTSRYYAHIGKYHCSSCNFKRPELKYKGYGVIHENYSEIYVKYNKNGNEIESSFKTNLIGLYNAYNVLAGISSALECGIDPETIQHALDTYKTMFGRAERLNIKGKNVFVQLIKNPTGASEVLRTINNKNTSKILMAINDNYADGRDMSWLWDTDFERLNGFPNNIIVSGIRAYDMATRLKYAGFPKEKIEVIENIKESVEYALKGTKENEQLLLMPTYTALLEMQKYLK